MTQAPASQSQQSVPNTSVAGADQAVVGSSSGQSSPSQSSPGQLSSGQSSPGQSATASTVQQQLHEAESLAAQVESLVTPPVSNAGSRRLAELDRSLSQHVDQMLQSPDPSVDAVLDDVFEEQATLVQHDHEQPAVPPTPKPRERAVDSRIVKAGTAEAATVAQALATPPPAAPESAAGPSNASDALSNENEARGGVAEAASVLKATAPELGSPSQSQPEPSPPTPASAPAEVANKSESGGTETEPLIAQQQCVATAGSISQPQVQNRTMHLTLLTLPYRSMLHALLVINRPWLYASKQTRTVLNWVALSMLAWVPIVWTAVMLTRSNAPDLATDSARPQPPTTEHSDPAADMRAGSAVTH